MALRAATGRKFDETSRQTEKTFPQRRFGLGKSRYRRRGHRKTRRLLLFVLFGKRLLRSLVQLRARRGAVEKLLGKWEKNPANPILPANDVWQCPGHGTIVKTPDGADFLLYHAYRKRADAFNIGREALLDKVEWTKDGWATINGGRGASNTANLPFASSKQQKSGVFVDEFDDSVLSPNWQLPLSPTETIDLKSGTLSFAANDAGEAVIATRTVSGNYMATVLIKTANMSADEISRAVGLQLARSRRRHQSRRGKSFRFPARRQQTANRSERGHKSGAKYLSADDRARRRDLPVCLQLQWRRLDGFGRARHRQPR